MRLARTGLKPPHEQKRAIYVTASEGVRRPSLTQSILFFARLCETIPCPHMVVSFSNCVLGSFSVLPSTPSEYPMLWRVTPAWRQHCSAPSIEVEIFTDKPRSASTTARRKPSADIRLLKIAATEAGSLMPSITARKSRFMFRFQFEMVVSFFEG